MIGNDTAESTSKYIKSDSDIRSRIPLAASPHGPIVIHGDAELTAFCSGNDTSGTEDDPHIIKDYDFEGTGTDYPDDFVSAIELRDTTLHVKILRCSFDSYYFGVNASNCYNVTVEQCNFNDTTKAVFMEECHNGTITGNTVNNTVYGGFELQSSANFTIDNNTIYHEVQGEGIYLRDSDDNNISNNYVSGEGHVFNTDLLLISDSDDNLIQNNTLTDGGTGIEIGWSHGNIIRNNTISGNGYRGINLFMQDDNNEIYHNLFIENEVNANSDTGPNTWHHDGLGNLYTDYQTQNPSATNDGRVWSEAYEINGAGNEEDPYPMFLDQYTDHYPIADFSYTVSDANPLSVSFTFTGETGDEPSSYQWTFDREFGTQSTEMNPDYTFDGAGEYNVTLTVTDDDGDTNSTWKVITITEGNGGGNSVPGFNPGLTIAASLTAALFIGISIARKRKRTELQTH